MPRRPPGGINRAPAQGLLDHDTNVFALNTFREGLTVADRSEETAGAEFTKPSMRNLDRNNAGRPPAVSDRTQKLRQLLHVKESRTVSDIFPQKDTIFFEIINI